MKNLKRKIESLRKECLLAKQVEYNKDKPLLTSMTGGIFWGHKGETWPVFNSKPLVPVLSILTKELPRKSRHFNNIQLINVFAYEEGAPIDEDEGSVVIRTYSDTKGLEPLFKPKELIKPCFKIKWEKVWDYPNGYQLEQVLSTEEYNLFVENEEELGKKYPSYSGIKIGGWPYLIQEIYFLKFDCPEFAFQFDSNEVFMFCDSGVGYFLNSAKNGWYSHWETF